MRRLRYPDRPAHDGGVEPRPFRRVIIAVPPNDVEDFVTAKRYGHARSLCDARQGRRLKSSGEEPDIRTGAREEDLAMMRLLIFVCLAGAAAYFLIPGKRGAGMGYGARGSRPYSLSLSLKANESCGPGAPPSSR